jgi:signal peptidase
VLRRLPTLIITLAALALAGLMLLPMALGYQRYVIVSGSMTGTYDKGSIVYDKAVPTEDLEVGDAITYAPPPGVSPQPLVTHRIWKIRTVKGERVYRTKGDAVDHPDPWTFTLPQATQARVDFSVPYAGYVIAALSDRHTRMLVIGGPALLIALMVLGGLARDVRRERREEREAPASTTTSAAWVRL